MATDDLEQLDRLVRATQQDRATRLVVEGDPLPTVVRRAAAVRRRRAAAVAAPLAAAVVVVVAVVASGGGGVRVAPDPAPTLPVSPAPVPAPVGLVAQLEADPAIARAFVGRPATGTLRCGSARLGRDGDEVYLWLTCGDYAADRTLRETTASSMPVVAHVSGVGDDLRVLDVEVPRQQTLDADLERMFPPGVLPASGDAAVRPSQQELLAEVRGEAPHSSSEASTSSLWRWPTSS